MHRHVFFTVLLLVSCSQRLHAQTNATANEITRIAFGSCIKQEKPAPILETIRNEKPELMLFTGDNIYADTEDMEVMRQKYQTLGEIPAFQRLVNSCQVLATWDDHDFGVNDGGADYVKRSESQSVFLDFWKVPTDSPRRQQRGVYHAQVFGPEQKRIQVILLDTRFFRSKLKTGDRRVGGPYYPDDDDQKTMLGDAQWRWLEQQLRIPAELRLIVSSIQFASADGGQECWANLPRERQRMLDLIESTAANGVVFISGDRHWSEISAVNQQTAYPLYDVTCSSLNQLHERGTPTDNPLRVSETTYHQENYGMLTIDWSSDPLLTFSIRDLEGHTVIEQKLRRSEISR